MTNALADYAPCRECHGETPANELTEGRCRWCAGREETVVAKTQEQLREELEASCEAMREAERRLTEARRAYDEAAHADLVARTERAYRAAEEAGFEDFVDPDPRYTGEREYVLPFGRDYGKWSPYDVENAAFGKKWLGGSFALICQRTDEPRSYPTRLIFSSGSKPFKDDRIGDSFLARHDQTGARLGVYKVVGIVLYDPDGNVGRVVGNVPDRKMSQNTYK